MLIQKETGVSPWQHPHLDLIPGCANAISLGLPARPHPYSHRAAEPLLKIYNPQNPVNPGLNQRPPLSAQKKSRWASFAKYYPLACHMLAFPAMRTFTYFIFFLGHIN